VDEAPLCDGCLQYAIDAKSRNNDGSIVWQCFVYEVLQDHIKRMQLWMIMPQQLREWWIEYAKNLPGMNDVSVDYPEVMVRDGTSALEELNHMTSNLKEVSWVDFQNVWEKYQSVPLVRCPWGCSEYYNSINSIAFDTLVGWHLGGNVPFYSSESERRCSIGFRKDVLCKSSYILNNPAWSCSVTLAFVTEKGIRVCTCRHHTSKDWLEYIHLPTNPTGAISFEGDNNLAQVVVVPRTVRSFQAKAF
jgi:hypothetical protein